MLLPGLRWAWRAPDTVQFGIDVPRPLVITGLSPLAADLLPAPGRLADRDALVLERADAPAAMVVTRFSTLTRGYVRGWSSTAGGGRGSRA